MILLRAGKRADHWVRHGCWAHETLCNVEAGLLVMQRAALFDRRLQKSLSSQKWAKTGRNLTEKWRKNGASCRTRAILPVWPSIR